MTIVPAIERGINEHEIGKIVEFAISHPAIRGVTFQPAFHAGRYLHHDPMRRMTIPDIVQLIEAQTDGIFLAGDFVPVPCCFPTCNSVTYAYVDGRHGSLRSRELSKSTTTSITLLTVSCRILAARSEGAGRSMVVVGSCRIGQGRSSSLAILLCRLRASRGGLDLQACQKSSS